MWNVELAEGVPVPELHSSWKLVQDSTGLSCWFYTLCWTSWCSVTTPQRPSPAWSLLASSLILLFSGAPYPYSDRPRSNPSALPHTTPHLTFPLSDSFPLSTFHNTCLFAGSTFLFPFPLTFLPMHRFCSHMAHFNGMWALISDPF